MATLEVTRYEKSILITVYTDILYSSWIRSSMEHLPDHNMLAVRWRKATYPLKGSAIVHSTKIKDETSIAKVRPRFFGVLAFWRRMPPLMWKLSRGSGR